uniref:Uncharacterized protein n=1 Tax=Rhizophora mucronata TaxID=61149 RepID=A0A2P2MLP3_RHIMU
MQQKTIEFAFQTNDHQHTNVQMFQILSYLHVWMAEKPLTTGEKKGLAMRCSYINTSPSVIN